jgi:FixJ family two-component response regulator
MTNGHQVTVAVVDDDEAVRDALGNLLASLGLRAATFASAEEFLTSPASGAAACLIIDVQMPGMGGLELQRRLAASGNRAPVILITAFPLEHVRRQADALGAVGFLVKPFEASLLIECLERALADKGGLP